MCGVGGIECPSDLDEEIARCRFGSMPTGVPVKSKSCCSGPPSG